MLIVTPNMLRAELFALCDTVRKAHRDGYADGRKDERDGMGGHVSSWDTSRAKGDVARVLAMLVASSLDTARKEGYCKRITAADHTVDGSRLTIVNNAPVYDPDAIERFAAAADEAEENG